MTTTDWPFGTDADRDDPLTKLRIPVVTSFNPELKYIAACIDVDIDPYSWGSKERPTDWGYRVVTWQCGPLFVPGPPGSESRQTVGPLSLEQAMDRDHDIYPKRRLDWKAAHPEVFPT
ncbi:hypothetical protein AB0D34_08385 [Streptomyces sp. NPDC048420]|uniref:hypothetical protein n=1 Tax=Streptomyces sp. NPDC048420 TaxID=3155755 RepID=UPI0034169B05